MIHSVWNSPCRRSCIIDRHSMTRLDKRFEVRSSGVFTTSFPTITERNRSGKLKFPVIKSYRRSRTMRAFHFRLRLLPSVRNIIRTIRQWRAILPIEEMIKKFSFNPYSFPRISSSFFNLKSKTIVKKFVVDQKKINYRSDDEETVINRALEIPLW